MSMLSDQGRARLENLVHCHSRAQFRRTLLWASCLFVVLAGSLSLWFTPMLTVIIAGLSAVSMGAWQQSKQVALTPELVLQHFNRQALDDSAGAANMSSHKASEEQERHCGNAFEESAHLAWRDSSQLSLLERMQVKRIQPALEAYLQRPTQVLLAKHFISQQATKAAVVANIVAIAFAAAMIFVVQPRLYSNDLATNTVLKSADTSSLASQSDSTPASSLLTDITLLITPPTYTGQEAYFSQQFKQSLAAQVNADTSAIEATIPSQQALHEQVPQGSLVTWLLPNEISTDTHIEVLLSHAPALAFTTRPNNLDAKLAAGAGLSAGLSAEQSFVYSLRQTTSYPVNLEFVSPTYSIEVLADSAPNIVILSPISAINEFPKDTKPSLLTRVKIQDDYGLADVEILASIAKGSGEAVKFRDQVFAFDRKESLALEGEDVGIGETNIYEKQWDLEALGMAPGDELYFSVRATDNRQPEPQISQSNTTILRWLEDEEEAMASDGILIDFMPEYFKSQRQIIIETQELIAQSKQMSHAEFTRTSRDLGIAQSDLKQKYGQYLGDEFESAQLHTMEAGPDFTRQAKQDTHDDDEHEHEHEHDDDDTSAKTKGSNAALGSGELAQDHGHAHDDAAGEIGINNDKSGYAAVVAQFGHQHGEATLGLSPIKKGQVSPTTLMKQAIANMWKAELHLQLSEPALALPFENEALSYLNRAKQAERIYVKRLGFEPPPVSEKRRYQGDLRDISSYQKQNQIDTKTPLQDSLALVIMTLQHYSSLTENTDNTGTPALFSTQQIAAMDTVLAHLNSLLSTQSQEISHVASLQMLRQAAQSNTPLPSAASLQSLQQRLWQLQPRSAAQSFAPELGYDPNHVGAQQYREFLEQEAK